MTQAEFDTLPALLTRRQVERVTGLIGRKLREAVDAGLIGFYKPRRGYRKYYKNDVARLVRWKA